MVGKEYLVKFWVENGADVNITDNFDNTPLMYAAKNGNKKTVEFLVEKQNADINAANSIGETPLHYAAKGGKRHSI